MTDRTQKVDSILKNALVNYSDVSGECALRIIDESPSWKRAKTEFTQLIDEEVSQEIGRIIIALPPESRKHLQPLIDAGLADLKREGAMVTAIETSNREQKELLDKARMGKK